MIDDFLWRDIEVSLQIIHGIHARIVTLLDSLTEVQWQRTGIHPSRGTMSVEDLAAIYAWHGDNHTDQIKKTLGHTT
ncbi:MAG: DinB family protein [Aggregatilineales bacterium]